MNLPDEVPADLSLHAVAVRLGTLVRETAAANGGDRTKAAAVVAFGLSDEWKELALRWALLQAESLAFRVNPPVASDGGQWLLATRPSDAPTDAEPVAETDVGQHLHDARAEPAPSVSAPIAGAVGQSVNGAQSTAADSPKPGRRASFFSRPNAELDYIVFFPVAGRKRIGDSTAEDWARRRVRYRTLLDTFGDGHKHSGVLENACGAGTLDAAWEKVPSKTKEWVRRETRMVSIDA